MSETRKSYFGQGIVKKVISWFMIMAMIIGLAPADFTLTAKAADDETTKQTIRIYFENSNNWEIPVINVWDTGAKVEGGKLTDIFGWSQGNGGEPWQQKPSLIKESGSNFWYADVTSDNWIGLQILDGPCKVWEAGATQKKNYLELDSSKEADNKVLGAINALEDGSSVYYLSSKGGWYKDKEGTTPLAAEEKTVTLHFLNTYNWAAPVIDTWKGQFVTVSGNKGTAVVTTWTDNQTPLPLMKVEKSTEDGKHWSCRWFTDCRRRRWRLLQKIYCRTVSSIKQCCSRCRCLFWC